MDFGADAKAQMFIRGLYDTNVPDDKKAYQEIFQDEGPRKIKKILDRVRKLDRAGQINLSKAGYLSIGGADGSEVKAFLENTPAKLGALIEISEFGVELAREHSTALKQKEIDFRVVQGDAVSNLPTAIEFFKENDCDCLIVSAQAVLHELIDRSDAFQDWNRFFSELYKHFPKTLLFSREPCLPSNSIWKDEIEFSIDGVEGETLAALCKSIGGRIGYFSSPSEAEKKITDVGNNFVLAPGPLAVETLHKFLRNEGLTSYQYECGEQLTSFDVEGIIEPLLMKLCGNPVDVQITNVTTDGFREAYEENGVTSRNPATGAAIQVPKTHVEIEAFAFKPEGNGKEVGTKKIEERLEPELPSFFSLTSEQLHTEASGDYFYNGVYQGIGAISQKLDIERAIFKRFVSSIHDSLKQVGKVTTLYVNGSFGSGKSVLVDRACWELRGADCNVIRFSPTSVDPASVRSELSNFVRKSNRDSIVVVDTVEEARQVELDIIGDSRSGHWLIGEKSIVIIAVDNWSIRRPPSPLSSANRLPHDRLFTVGKLTVSEIEALLIRVVSAENSGTISDVRCFDSYKRRLEVCLADDDRLVIHVLLKIRYGLNVNAALQIETNSIQSQPFMQLYRTTTILNALGFGTPGFLRELAVENSDPDFPYARTEGELIPRIDDGNWVRHRILLPRLLKILFDETGDRANSFSSILKNLELDDDTQRDFLIRIISNFEIIPKLRTLLQRENASINDIANTLVSILSSTTDELLKYHLSFFLGRINKDLLRDSGAASDYFEQAYAIDDTDSFLVRLRMWSAFESYDLPSAEKFARVAISKHSHDYQSQSAAAHVLKFCSKEGFTLAGKVYETLSESSEMTASDERRMKQYNEAATMVEAIASEDLSELVLETLKAPSFIWKSRKGAQKQYRNSIKRELGSSLRNQRFNPDKAEDLLGEVQNLKGGNGDKILKGLISAHAARFRYEKWYHDQIETDFDELLSLFEEAEKLLLRDPFVTAWKGTFIKECLNDFEEAKKVYIEAIQRQSSNDLDYIRAHPMMHNNMALLLLRGVQKGNFPVETLSDAIKHAETAVRMMNKTDGEFSWPIETEAEIIEIARERGISLQ